MSGERRQDARLERIVEEAVTVAISGLGRALGALRFEVDGSIVDGLQDKAREAARTGILHALAAAGVDTSAHVTAPAVEVNVHRRPGHDEDV